MWPHLVIPFTFFAWNSREQAKSLFTHYVTARRVDSNPGLYEQGSSDLTTRQTPPVGVFLKELKPEPTELKFNRHSLTQFHVKTLSLQLKHKANLKQKYQKLRYDGNTGYLEVSSRWIEEQAKVRHQHVSNGVECYGCHVEVLPGEKQTFHQKQL